MCSTGGNTEMIQMSCFSNMKIYTRYVATNIVFNFAICFYKFIFTNKFPFNIEGKSPGNEVVSKQIELTVLTCGI